MKTIIKTSENLELLKKEYKCVLKTIKIITSFKKMGYKVDSIYNDYLKKKELLINKINTLKKENEKR